MFSLNAVGRPPLTGKIGSVFDRFILFLRGVRVGLCLLVDVGGDGMRLGVFTSVGFGPVGVGLYLLVDVGGVGIRVDFLGAALG